MADTLTSEERSERMSRVRSRGNRATELRLIRLMREHRIIGWRRGLVLPGKPDFTFRAAKVVLFVDGCFWHGCPRHARTPKTRVAFWKAKLARNAQRDREVTRVLRTKGVDRLADMGVRLGVLARRTHAGAYHTSARWVKLCWQLEHQYRAAKPQTP